MNNAEIADNLPLLELFTRLRQAGLPLGIDEYQLLLRALQHGFGLPDRAALARLCKTLWIKSSDEECIFDYHFEQVFVRAHLDSSTSSQSSSPEKPSQKDKPPPPDLTTPRDGSTTTPSSTSSTELSTVSSAEPELTLKMEDEVQIAKAISHATSSGEENIDISFIQTDEYFPLTRRQMKQSWRYLRNRVAEGPPVELDVNATAREIARQGLLLHPVLVPRRVNHTELLLLIDQGGSMVPFHALSRRLAETALRGGRLERAGIYYFHNCPTEYLYRDHYHHNAVSLQQTLEHLHASRAKILIFSDAGAARGGFNLERAEMTQHFITHLKQHVRFIAWLNPMPRSRWLSTTAGEIMQFVPMFDVSRRGLDEAINVLRGRPTPYLHIKAGRE